MKLGPPTSPACLTHPEELSRHPEALDYKTAFRVLSLQNLMSILLYLFHTKRSRLNGQLFPAL
jgi:hypothetical protein